MIQATINNELYEIRLLAARPRRPGYPRSGPVRQQQAASKIARALCYESSSRRLYAQSHAHAKRARYAIRSTMPRQPTTPGKPGNRADKADVLVRMIDEIQPANMLENYYGKAAPFPFQDRIYGKVAGSAAPLARPQVAAFNTTIFSATMNVGDRVTPCAGFRRCC
ncbi:hypothetical protein KCP77_10305 [Salmonella enterica subsp. enterica]|nr:hypothetical protein KCP77_10305 [Salmonella enterica subsp. enterica]